MTIDNKETIREVFLDKFCTHINNKFFSFLLSEIVEHELKQGNYKFSAFLFVFVFVFIINQFFIKISSKLKGMRASVRKSLKKSEII